MHSWMKKEQLGINDEIWGIAGMILDKSNELPKFLLLLDHHIHSGILDKDHAL